MQKTYHEDNLPYTPRKNNGELEKYYVYNTHEPIIDRETFEATQALLKKKCRQKGITTVNNNSLYRIIVCGNCGKFFKRKVIRNKAYWICYNHNIRNEYCKMKPISENSIINAFNVMYSKLKLNSQYILDPAIAQMNELRTILRQGNKRICEIDKRLAELNEKKHIIIKLNNKQLMDDITYQTEKNATENEIAELRKERKQQLANEHEDDVLEQLTELQSIINCKSPCNDNFDSELFMSIVEKIIVIDENNITLVLLGGLTLNEHLERNESNEA